MASEQPGIVAERFFDDGQRVKKGDVLVKLNTDLLVTERDAAQAALKMAQGELAQAKSELSNAQREEKRLKELFETNVAPRPKCCARNAPASTAVKKPIPTISC